MSYLAKSVSFERAAGGDIGHLAHCISPFAFIAGSAARHAALDGNSDGYEDIDVFLKKPESLNIVGRILVALGYLLHSTTDNAHIYDKEGLSDGTKVQVILPVNHRCGDPEAVLNYFDVTVNAAALYAWQGGLEVRWHKDLEQDFKDRRLQFMGPIGDPMAMIYRLMKYHRKGYSVAPSMIGTVFNAWQAIDEDTQEEMLSKQAEMDAVLGSFG